MGLLSTGAGTRNTAWDYSAAQLPLAVNPAAVIDCQDVFANAFMQISVSGAPSAISVNLECSVDGLNWTVLGNSTSTSSTPSIVYGTSGIPFRLLRANVVSFTGGTSPKLTAFVGALPGAAAASGGGTGGSVVTANQGSPNTVANSWPVEITNGTTVVSVDVPTGGGNTGNGLLVSTGNITPGTSLSAATTGNGTTIDFGSTVSNPVFQIVSNGTITAGAVTMQVSLDGVSWSTLPVAPGTAPYVGLATLGSVAVANPLTLATGQIALFTVVPVCPIRYARVNVSTTVTGGTVTALISES